MEYTNEELIAMFIADGYKPNSPYYVFAEWQLNKGYVRKESDTEKRNWAVARALNEMQRAVKSVQQAEKTILIRNLYITWCKLTKR